MNKILALLLILISTSVLAERKLVIMIGQSETSGRGNLSEVPTYEHADRIWLYGNDGVWHNPASEPTDDHTNGLYSGEDDGGAVGSSFGMPLANRLAELYPTDEVAIINCSKGGSKIAQFRQYWTNTSRYGSCNHRVIEALKDSTLYGLTFWVGAADATSLSNVNGWVEYFSELMTDWRTDLGDINLPIAAARLNNENPSGKPYWNTLRGYQNIMSARNLTFVDTDGVGYIDKVHPTTAGNQILGVRFADALYEIKEGL